MVYLTSHNTQTVKLLLKPDTPLHSVNILGVDQLELISVLVPRRCGIMYWWNMHVVLSSADVIGDHLPFSPHLM